MQSLSGMILTIILPKEYTFHILGYTIMLKTQTWQPQDLIRNLRTGNVYIVLNVLPQLATLIAPLNDTSELPQTLTLFPRQYEYYTKDANVVYKNGSYLHDTIEL